MKLKLICLIAFLLLEASNETLFAQSPQKFSFQAVIRNGSNMLLSNQLVGIRVRILQGSSSGTIVYAEYHNVTTNSNGLASLEIGSGSVLSGNFSTINWASGIYYLRTDTDPAGGTNYTITSNAQLLSVPFALYSTQSGNGRTILNGISNPSSSVGNEGDFYINTSTQFLFGPKTSGSWGSGISLIGPAGPSGATGTSGAAGKTILNGTSNPLSGQGTDGDFFLNTSTRFLFGPKTAGVWGAGVSLTGPAGVDGRTILSGASNPTSGLGTNGDFYINTANSTLFGPKASGAWPAGISLVGPTGATGSPGIQGATGAQGPAGIDGRTILHGTVNPASGIGLPGDFYINTSSNTLFGPRGASSWPVGISLIGPTGATGSQGPQGLQGATGATGPAGTNGKTILNGTNNPSAIQGVDGDFYLNTSTRQLFGPKAGGAWPAGVSLIGPQGAAGTNGTNGSDGKTVLNGTVNPGAGTGTNGDFYINTTTNTLFGPKAGGAWPAGVSLTGPQGAAGTNGTNGSDGKTVLNGTVNPGAGTGTNGDFYINTTTNTLFGPKAGGNWPTGVSLTGPQGAAGTNGTNGSDGKTVLNGTVNPGSGTGTNGDFYINTFTNTLFGPKAGGNWPTGVSLTGPQGAAGTNGTNGSDGKTVLNGTVNPGSGTGTNGDFYINTSTNTLFGPKAGGAWPAGISLVGPAGPQGPSGTANLLTDNGLNKDGDTLKWGGRLIEPVFISQNNRSIQILDNDGATGVIDISQTSFSPTTNLSASPSTQTFTAINQGRFHSFRIRVTAINGSTITLALRNSGGNTLFSQSVNYTASFDNWQTFTPGSSLLQNTGEVYTLSVTGSAGTTWYYSSTNVYAGGQSSININRDFAFETYLFEETPVMVINGQKVGIANSNPAAKLDVNGKTRTSLFQLTNNAGNGSILVSDANGNGEWMPIGSVGVGTLDQAYDFGGRGIGRNIVADSGAVRIIGEDGFSVSGSFGNGDEIESSGNGTRMWFNPRKAAFRVGHSGGTFWDKDSVGNYSVAAGLATKAKATASIALGNSTEATGNSSVALGNSTKATGAYSFAAGISSEATGASSIAMGYFAKAPGAQSAALGEDVQAKGSNSTSLGYNSVANGYTSLVVGQFNDSITSAQTSMRDTTALFLVGNGNSGLARSNAFVVRKDARVGIGTSYPKARLHVKDSSVVFEGLSSPMFFNIPPPVSGAGARLMWYVEKDAFRCGRVSGNQWDADSVGIYTTAMGYNPVASSHAATAIGFNVRATENYAIAMGDHSEANGTYSIGMGRRSIANGTGSIALGVYDSSMASYSTAIGFESVADSLGTLSLGYKSKAIGQYSIAFSNARSQGRSSIAMGTNNIANGTSGLVVGVNNDTIVAPQTSYNALTPLFIVGNGSSPTNRSNALVVRYDGGVGLGVNTPAYQLQLSTNSAAKPSSSSWTIASDARLKTIDGPYTRGLSDILKLNTIQYHYKPDMLRKLPVDETCYGLVAQELKQVFPEAVHLASDGYYGVDMHPILIAYINAFKELNQQNENLRKEMMELRGELANLKAQLPVTK